MLPSDQLQVKHFSYKTAAAKFTDRRGLCNAQRGQESRAPGNSNYFQKRSWEAQSWGISALQVEAWQERWLQRNPQCRSQVFEKTCLTFNLAIRLRVYLKGKLGNVYS